MDTDFKVCRKCKSTKSVSEFFRDSSKSDGLRGDCKECKSEYDKEYAKLNSKSISKKRKRRYLQRRDLERHQQKKYYQENKERFYEASREWKKRNPDRVLSWTRQRQSSKINATPPWLSRDHKKNINEYYWLARDLKAVSGEDYHVDHIVPLKGESVCGLHVPWNLQVLPSDLNIAKSNKHLDTKEKE